MRFVKEIGDRAATVAGAAWCCYTGHEGSAALSPDWAEDATIPSQLPDIYRGQG